MGRTFAHRHWYYYSTIRLILIYHPSEGGRLSRPRHCSQYAACAQIHNLNYVLFTLLCEAPRNNARVSTYFFCFSQNFLNVIWNFVVDRGKLHSMSSVMWSKLLKVDLATFIVQYIMNGEQLSIKNWNLHSSWRDQSQ